MTDFELMVGNLVNRINPEATILWLVGFAMVATVFCVLRDAFHYFRR